MFDRMATVRNDDGDILPLILRRAKGVSQPAYEVIMEGIPIITNLFDIETAIYLVAKQYGGYNFNWDMNFVQRHLEMFLKLFMNMIEDKRSKGKGASV